MFVDIIEPLGYRAKEKNDVYEQEFASMKNKCVREFTNEYCDEDGRINWEKLVRYNAALKAAK